MNERIKELAEQATKRVTKPDGHYIVQEWQKVFAELIVQECMSKAKQGKLTNMNGDQIAWVIKEHFGVEE